MLSRLTALLAVVALLAVAGCGDDESDGAAVSTTTVTAAADEQSATTSDDSEGETGGEASKALQDEIAALRDESGKTDGSSEGQGAGFSATSCGAGVYVRSSNTSCAFALNVAADFFNTPGFRFYSYSPVTGQTYLVRCTRTVPSLCRAGNGARILIT